MTAPTPQDLLLMLNDALADNHGAMIIVIEKDADGSPIGLRVGSSPMSPATVSDIAEFVVEQAIKHCRQFVKDGSADTRLPHLTDALHSLQAASEAPAKPTIGRA